MVYQKLTVCNCKGTNKGGSRLSGHVAHATPDRRLRRTRIFIYFSLKILYILKTNIFFICRYHQIHQSVNITIKKTSNNYQLPRVFTVTIEPAFTISLSLICTGPKILAPVYIVILFSK